MPGKNIGKLILPKSTIVVKSGAFERTMFISIVCNEGLKEIESDAFSNCYYLSEVHFPKTIEKIDDDAFNMCYCLTTVYGYTDTEAERFAIYNRLRFISLDDLEP